jgi:hypothetical protein
MKKSIFISGMAIIMMAFITTKLSAQANYKTGVGIRGGGYENGLTIKHFTNSSTAIEGILGFRPGVVVLTGLYEKHAVAFSERSLNWYYGIGAHIGAIDGDRYYRRYGKDRYYDDNELLIGADGILGLEWKIPEIPFALSIDLHPRLELARGPYLGIEPAASLRFTF